MSHNECIALIINSSFWKLRAFKIETYHENAIGIVRIRQGSNCNRPYESGKGNYYEIKAPCVVHNEKVRGYWVSGNIFRNSQIKYPKINMIIII